MAHMWLRLEYKILMLSFSSGVVTHETYTVFHTKTTRYLTANNFGKCWPIFKILSLSDSAVNV